MKVTLLPGSYPSDPIKAIWSVWEQSRCDASVEIMLGNYEVALEAEKKGIGDKGTWPYARFRSLLQMGVPIMEFLHFTFLLEEIPVSFREQLVRHKIGMKVGPQLGFDDIPDIADSTFWSQTSRVRDLQNFFDNGYYYTPELDNATRKDVENPFGKYHGGQLVLAPDGMTDLDVYRFTLEWIQWGYRELRKRGYNPEIAREVIPMSMTHRIAWHVNCMTLKRLCGDRSCWIAQAGYWHPIIMGIVSELTTKIDPVFSALATPPCIDKKTDCFKSCPFGHENTNRLHGKVDPGIPCSLWIRDTYNLDLSLQQRRMGVETYNEVIGTIERAAEFERMIQQYHKFWNRDPFTGKLL